jgi:hypothetical protein
MSTPSAQDWFKQFEAMSQQYWGAWNNLAQQATQTRPMPDATAPWAQGVQQWAQMFGDGGKQSDVVDRITANAKAYVALMQSMITSAAGAPGGGSAASWTEALKNGFNVPGIDAALLNNPIASGLRDLVGKGAQGFDEMMAQMTRGVAPFKQEMLGMMNLPAFGIGREQQEHLQELGTAFVDYQEQSNRYNALMLKASQRGFEMFQAKLADREEPGRQLDSVRAVYDLWVDAAEEAYGEIALSEEFRKIYGAQVNAQMRVRSLMQKSIEQQTRQLGIPTRTEIASVEKAVHDLRRSMRDVAEASTADLAKEVAALRAEVAALKKQAGTPSKKSAGARATRTAAVKSSPRKR